MKTKIIFASIIFILLCAPALALAQDETTLPLPAPKPVIKIPTLDPFSNKTVKEGQTVTIPWIAQYIIAVYRYAIIIGSVFAVVALMVGGILYIVSPATPSAVTTAKSIIFGAISGLVLIIGSYLILNIINPELTTIKSLKIEGVKKELLPEENELTANCKNVDNNMTRSIITDASCEPSKLRELTTGDSFVQGAGQFLQDEAAGAFKNWMNDFKHALLDKRWDIPTIIINESFRTPARQECLRREKPNLANKKCDSWHEAGLAVDIQTSTLKHFQMHLLITTGLNNGFKNAIFSDGAAFTGTAYKSSSSYPYEDEDLRKDDAQKELWKTRAERWHWTYQSGQTKATAIDELCPGVCSATTTP